MATDLDTRIRRLVREVVDESPVPPDLSTSDGPKAAHERRPLLFVAAATAVVILLAVLGVGLIARGDRAITPLRSVGGAVTLDLDDVPPGVSARKLDGFPVFLVRRGDEVTTFISNPQRFPTETEMWWCPSEHVFAAPVGGEVFNSDGRKAGGPAVRGMDRFATDIRDDSVIVHLDHVLPGPTHSGPLVRPTFPSQATWNSGASSFCSKPVVAGTGTVRIPFDRIPEGVTFTMSRRGAEFIVRSGDDVHLFISSAQHLKGETKLVWCPSEQVFYSPTHGEKFSSTGARVNGPASHDLDRVATRVDGDTLVIHPDRVIRGARSILFNLPPNPPCPDPVEAPAGEPLSAR